jgi:hypothetical protein
LERPRRPKVYRFNLTIPACVILIGTVEPSVMTCVVMTVGTPCRCLTRVAHNRLLTKLDYLDVWAFGARMLACGPAGSIGVDPWPLTPKSSSP